MNDIQNWAKLIRGRWDWNSFGYERGFPRKCGFTDLDASVEFDGSRLVIETKQHDGFGSCDYPATGQLLSLRDEASLGKTVLVVYGCGVCNDPQAVRIIGRSRDEDMWLDWRGKPKEERRRLLKAEIDRALRLVA